MEQLLYEDENLKIYVVEDVLYEEEVIGYWVKYKFKNNNEEILSFVNKNRYDNHINKNFAT